VRTTYPPVAKMGGSMVLKSEDGRRVRTTYPPVAKMGGG